MNSPCLQRSAIWSSEKVACQFNWGRSYLIFLYTGIVFNKTTYAYNTAMADVSRLLEVGSGEYIQWILKSVSSCLEGRGGTLQHTHMFLKCSNVLLFYCRCITEMKFNNLLYTMPIKRKDSLPWRSWTKYKWEAVQSAAAPRAHTLTPHLGSRLPQLPWRHRLVCCLLRKGGLPIKKKGKKESEAPKRSASSWGTCCWSNSREPRAFKWAGQHWCVRRWGLRDAGSPSAMLPELVSEQLFFSGLNQKPDFRICISLNLTLNEALKKDLLKVRIR